MDAAVVSTLASISEKYVLSVSKRSELDSRLSVERIREVLASSRLDSELSLLVLETRVESSATGDSWMRDVVF